MGRKADAGKDLRLTIAQIVWEAYRCSFSGSVVDRAYYRLEARDRS